MINERIFGSPISGQVRKKLEDRQRVAGEVEFGDSIEAVYPDKDGQNQADLSSRTPFVRMWTSVKLVNPESPLENLEEIPGYTTFDTYEEYRKLTNLQRQTYNRAQRKLRNLKQEFEGVAITKIKGADGVDRFYFTYTREQIDYARKIYIVGDYNYQTAYGSVNTNDSLDNYASEMASSYEDETSSEVSNATQVAEDLFPQELKNNPLLKPQAGITSVTSETEGPLGVIKRTVVNFVVHNFEDYDKIYNRFFLRPGATIFVDFGWSSVKNLYDPAELSGNTDVQKFLYNSNVVPGYEEQENEELGVEGESVEGEGLGIITENQGDLEVIEGVVVDYSSKVLHDGSVECSVTLVSSNNTLLDFKLDSPMKNHISDVLNHATLVLGLESVLQDVRDSGEYSDKEIDAISLLQNVPNKDTSAEDLVLFEDNLTFLSYKYLGGKDLTPDSNEVRTGVFVNTAEADDIFISWGFIEDIIFNQNFGFGKNYDDIIEGQNLSVRMDSSNQFTTWDKIFVERQKTLSKVPEEAPVFIYPEWWGDSDPGVEDSVNEEIIEGDGSYSYVNKKYPKRFYSNEPGQHTTIDESKRRIPIREVFINVEVIVSSFQRNNNVKGALLDLLRKINDDSDGVFDWKPILGNTDAELQIIDNNRLDINQRIMDSGASNLDTIAEESVASAKDEFNFLFMFNIMSPNSIIKDYNLEFKIPQGNIGNMYAIQGMSHENKVFPISNDIDDIVAINALDDDSLSIVYEPDKGSYRSNQINNIIEKDAGYFDVYNGAKYLLDNNIYKNSAIRTNRNELGEQGLFDSKINPDNNSGGNNQLSKKQTQTDLIERNIKIMSTGGIKVVNNFTDYFKLREMQEINLKTRANLLPYSLSLTTYGIGSIQPGDTFRVDYLPKQHFKNTYLQTMKVTHNINSDGWYTSLDTQYRILGADIKKSYYLDIDRDKVFLSPNVLDNLNIKEGYIYADLTGGRKSTSGIDIISLLKPCMMFLKVKNLDAALKHIDLILSFKTTTFTEELTELVKRLPSQSNPDLKDFIANSKFRVEQSLFTQTQINAVTQYRFKEQRIAKTIEKDLSKIGFGTREIFWPVVSTLEENENYLILIRGEASCIIHESQLTAFLTYFDNPQTEVLFTDFDAIADEHNSTLGKV